MSTNGLPVTVEECKAIVKLMEECGEVVQACAKILAHGMEGFDPADPGITNRKHLMDEIADASAWMIYLMKFHNFNTARVNERAQVKLAAIPEILSRMLP